MSDKNKTLEDWMLRHIIEDIEALSPDRLRQQMLEDIENLGHLSSGYIKMRIVSWLDVRVEETHLARHINYLDGIVDDVRCHYFPQTAQV